MLLTNDELELVREAVAIQSGMDKELVQRCSPLIHINAFDEAVQKAFVVLEERLRKMLKMQGGTGAKIIQNGFSENGLFTKLLRDNTSERDALQHLLTGAFSLYRNAAAHTIVGFSGAEARSIIGLIDLLLRRFDLLASLPRTDSLPANVESTLNSVQTKIGPKDTNQVRIFLAKCLHAGLMTDSSATKWIPFRTRALTQRPNWDAPKPHILAVFYFFNDKDQALWFPVNTYYKHVIGIDTEDIMRRLRRLGFQLTDSAQEPYLSVNTARDKGYYDQLFGVVQEIIKELDATLQ